MKVEKFKVLLYLKKSGLDKSGKAPIMGRITVNRTMAQFGCKLSCTPELWNPRESRLNGKSKERLRPMPKLRNCCLPSTPHSIPCWSESRNLTLRRSRICFRGAWTSR